MKSLQEDLSAELRDLRKLYDAITPLTERGWQPGEKHRFKINDFRPKLAERIAGTEAMLRAIE